MLDRPLAGNASLSARDIASHRQPSTNARRLESKEPFVILRGDGIRVFNADGHDCIDAMAGLRCMSLGFAEERLAPGRLTHALDETAKMVSTLA
jgi:adenosylmethionine-8-amino-7-oxononanoate aminotransferase